MNSKTNRKKIAFIVQRYGLEVNGGAETHCRLIAERLVKFFDVEVLTSCALNYKDWTDHFSNGVSSINGVEVKRFASANVKSEAKAHQLNRYLRRRKWYQKALKMVGLIGWAEQRFNRLGVSEQDFENWIFEQGPALPTLVSFLKENHQQYQALIFFTYLYYPTVVGLKVAPQKSILIPTAHDERAIYIPFFKSVFTLPKAIFYNTLSEKTFVNRLFNNENVDADIVGVGVDLPAEIKPIDVKSAFKIDSDYIVYIGRVEAGKGCKELIKYFEKYLNESGKKLKLVLVGQLFMKLTPNENIISLGFVSEEIKYNVLQQAKALVISSPYESLSMVTLEAMYFEKAVIVNGKCDVLKQHVERSKSGFIYHNYAEFATAIDKLDDAELLLKMAVAGKIYVDTTYNWDVIIEKFTNKIEQISLQDNSI